MLIFGSANAKLIKLQEKFKRKLYTFSTLSGFCCPYAKDCDSRAIVGDNGKRTIKDGPHTKFRCFSASQEVLFTNVYESRKKNWDMLLTAKNCPVAMSTMIQASLPKKASIVRINVAGDFFTKAYFVAWLNAAANNPNVLFYAYTKSLPFWVWAKNEGIIPDNFILTASYGGYRDDLIDSHKLRFAKVVFSRNEAKNLGLPIDSDDSHAADPKKSNESFALLLHGVQPKGSDASNALKKLKGDGSYGKD